MKDKLRKKLETLVKKHGWSKVAVMINEKDTQNLKRWIKSRNIPDYRLNVIDGYLRRKK